MAKLIIKSGTGAGGTVGLPEEEGGRLAIGRSAECGLRLDDERASRVHAEILRKEGRYLLRDLRSKNGTLHNGQKVYSISLSEGDSIQIGDVVLVFSVAGILPADPEGAGGEAAERGKEAAQLPPGGAEAEGAAAPGSATLANFEALRPEEVRLEQRAGERAQRALSAIYALARAAAGAASTAQLFEALGEQLSQALEADRVVPILVDAEGALLPFSRGRSALEERLSRVPLSTTIVEHARDTGFALLTAPQEDRRFQGAESITRQRICSAMCVPITLREALLGLLYADRLEGSAEFQREDLELLSAAAQLAAGPLYALRRLEEALRDREKLAGELRGRYNLLGESPEMQEVYRFIERAAPAEAGVLILGESGTGKELVARAIHYHSQRQEKAFEVVSCAALTESLVESELFGHLRGAFTGATADRPGRFEAADGGTIFLDEIGELPASCQAKLLRVLEQGEFSRVGETKVRKVDVRVIAATNRDLDGEVEAGHFRRDLFYRLNVLKVTLPPLRQRGQDVELLLDHYLREFSLACGRPQLRLAPPTRARLLQYRWPGNVRELKNLTERLAVLAAAAEISPEELPAEFHAGSLIPPTTVLLASAAKGAPAATLAEMEKAYIQHTLEVCGGNKKLAAETLGIDRTTLYDKLRFYQRGPEREKERKKREKDQP